MWMLGEDHKPQKCKECDYSDFCGIIEVPSDEVCEAIRACAKDFLYEKVWESLEKYFTEKENNDETLDRRCKTCTRRIYLVQKCK